MPAPATPLDAFHTMLPVALGAAGPALGTLAGMVACRRMRSDLRLMVAVPLQSLWAAIWVSVLVVGMGIQPALPLATGAILMVVVGEILLLILGLLAPSSDEPSRAFEVMTADATSGPQEERAASSDW